mmetsp:Transcript_38261/g.33816  ORF Transcript_38261/g.33816 Transcript_38261/m.33816 type:complete len:104 (+) Transcript_38261:84-395(+)
MGGCCDASETRCTVKEDGVCWMQGTSRRRLMDGTITVTAWDDSSYLLLVLLMILVTLVIIIWYFIIPKMHSYSKNSELKEGLNNNDKIIIGITKSMNNPENLK